MTDIISKERLEKIAFGSVRQSQEEGVFIAREALAYREAESEPVAWIVHTHGPDQLTTDGDYVANDEGMHGLNSTPLYTSPVLSQPVPNNSKPVAEIVSKHGGPEAFGERELHVIADIRKMPYGTKLYASPVLGQTSELREIAIRVVACISASGYTPKENSLNPLEALLFDAEKALGETK